MTVINKHQYSVYFKAIYPVFLRVQRKPNYDSTQFQTNFSLQQDRRKAQQDRQHFSGAGEK